MPISDEKTVCKKCVETVETWAEANDIRTTAEGIIPAGELRRISFRTAKTVNDEAAELNARTLIRTLRSTLSSETKRLSDIQLFRIECASGTTVPPGQEEVRLSFYF